MDAEQLIPHAGELEWLETNSLLAEYEEEEDFPFNEQEIGVDDGDLPDSAALPHAHESQVTRKRVWSEESDATENIGEIGMREERGSKRRALELVVEEQDEDWLRFSPLPPKAATVHLASESDHLMAEAPIQEKILSRFVMEIEGDCVPVTGPYGERVYAKMQSSKTAGKSPKKLREHLKDGLLSEPISIILKTLDNEAFAKAFEENDHLPCHLTHPEVPTFSEKLWVEKYAPCSFTELLSDEQTNREVLLWLKQWDSSVFGSQVRLTSDDVLSALRRHSSTVQHKKFSDGKTFFEQGKGAPFTRQNLKPWNALDRQIENLNGFSESWSRKATADHPPEQKVLLLCGPPGLGKTTLAHVAAKHCGYRVIEINASDDRSFSTLESKILDVVQMASVTVDSKPKCLVIDEIDGALGEGKGAVEVILKMVAADKKANIEKCNSIQQSLSEFSSKKGKKSATLLRPVICICNDLYAPALRPLRQIAKVHMFVQPTISRVVNRLKYVCQKEGLKTNSIALAALAEYTECDIRSCLNTLQFLNKKKETLNILEVGSQVIGHKDISRSCFDIWNKIFQNGKSKRAKSSTSSFNGHGDFEFMYSLLSNRGDYDLTMDGIHENLLRLSYIDPMMTKTVTCLDMLGVSDSLHQYITRTQQMSLHAFQPPLAIAIKRLIALVDKPNIEWPKSSQRCRAMSMERKDLLKLWQSKISPIISRHLSNEYFAEDFVSLFLHILVPPTLRPVALHLFSEREKDDLAQLVDTMVSYSITYKSSKAETLKGPHHHGIANDVPILTLYPPIDDFINFKDYQPTHIGFSLAMKQVLLHEVEKQRILRENSGISLNPGDEYNQNSQASTISNSEVLHDIITKSASVKGSDKPRLAMLGLQNEENRKNLNSKIKIIASNASITAEVTVDLKNSSRPTSFFDRFRQGCYTDSKNQASNLQKAATAERDSRPFLFRYNEVNEVLSSKINKDEEYDIAIVGGGMVGLALACGLSSMQLTKELSVAIIDSNPALKSRIHFKKAEVPHPRVSTLTPATISFFEEIGAWEYIEQQRHAYFNQMQVWDYSGLGYTRYHARDVGKEYLGCVVENMVLCDSLLSCLQNLDFQKAIHNAVLTSIKFPSEFIPTITSKEQVQMMGDFSRVASSGNTIEPMYNGSSVKLCLSNGKNLYAKLVVGADGAKSHVREMAGLKTTGWNYPQNAVICTVEHSVENHCAWQRFLHSGPIALLPIGDKFSNIVWTMSPEESMTHKTMSRDAFVKAVNYALDYGYGSRPQSSFLDEFVHRLSSISGHGTASMAEPFQVPLKVTDVVSERMTFPLSLRHAREYVSKRVVLIGDAAHAVHPLAGQGVNLGFGDAAALSKVIDEGLRVGADIGELSLLKKYEKERKSVNLTMMALLDGFQKAYSMDFGPLNFLRAAAFHGAQFITPLKRNIISYAMGEQKWPLFT